MTSQHPHCSSEKHKGAVFTATFMWFFWAHNDLAVEPPQSTSASATQNRSESALNNVAAQVGLASATQPAAQNASCGGIQDTTVDFAESCKQGFGQAAQPHLSSVMHVLANKIDHGEFRLLKSKCSQKVLNAEWWDTQAMM